MGASTPGVSPTWPERRRAGIGRVVEPGATRRRASPRAPWGRAWLIAAFAATSLGASGCSGSEGPLVEHELLLPLELPKLPEAPLPELAKKEPEKLLPWAPKAPAMHHVLAVDHGIRSDRGGKGHFLAPRAHGKHNGIDYLAPVGTPVLAACAGKAKSDERGGYGRVVQLVCELPDVVDGPEGLHASFFYAHLDKAAVPKRWTQVKQGDKLGTVGKTGNAAGPKIMPHLHLEVIARRSEKEALEERHAGLLPEAAEAATALAAQLEAACLEPAGFAPQKSALTRERRVDPFVLITCGSTPRPTLSEPSEPNLKNAMVRWSAHYAARGFDVDLGPR